MSIVYGSYFSTSGGKNFVRPVIDYTVSYTATTVSVRYKAGINVKSGYHTSAKFTSTFSATGQASKTRVDDNKKWGGGNHFIFGSTTITYNKTISAQTKTLKIYSKTNVDSSSKSVSISIPALGLPTIFNATAGRVESTPTNVTVSFSASSNNSAITAKINKEVVTAVNGVYSKAFTNVSSDQHNYVITVTDSVGTSTRTLTVPKLTIPQVDIEATRDETDTTKVVFNITANSFYKDNISSISIAVGSTSATVTGGEIDDSNALTVTKAITGLAETILTATVSVTGYGGTATLFVTIPSAFRTFDVGGKGKTIAFGTTARDENFPKNGLLECSMDAVFNGNTEAKDVRVSTERIKIGRYIATGILTSSGGSLHFSIPLGRVLKDGATVKALSFRIVVRASSAAGNGVYIIKSESGGTSTAVFSYEADKTYSLSNPLMTFYDGANNARTPYKKPTILIEGNTFIYFEWLTETNYYFAGSSAVNGNINNNACTVFLSNIVADISYE